MLRTARQLPHEATGDSWQQYYPTYKFKNRDIVLREYDSSIRNAESQETVFLQLANLTLVVAAVLSSLAAWIFSPSKTPGLITLRSLVSLYLAISIFAVLTLRHFAARYRSIVFDSRKVVVLRRMLGLDYGTQHLVLPGWRIDGASDPFLIKMFPGWLAPVAQPFWAIGAFTSLLFFNLSPLLYAYFSPEALPLSELHFAVLVCVIWMIGLGILFRQCLYDSNENARLSIARFFAGMLRLRIKGDIEYVLYRARLAKFEMQRIGIDTRPLLPILIFIEDRDFRKHNGISLKAIGRAALGCVGLRRPSGGSTITQQLARTLFIVDMNRRVSRKIVEIPMALWLESVCSKQELLEIYLASVRFDHGIYGIAAARRHFFGEMCSKGLSIAQSFFLIERISNVTSSILAGKIADTLSQMESARILNSNVKGEILSIYKEKATQGKIRPLGLDKLSELLSHQPIPPNVS